MGSTLGPRGQAGGGGDRGWGAAPWPLLRPRRPLRRPPSLAPRAPGLLPAPDGESREGLICRKTFSSDLVSGSRELLPGVGPGSSQYSSPRALAGRETEMVAAETGAPAPERPRGAGAFEGFAASCQGQSNPSHAQGGARRVLLAAGGEGLEVGVPGQASPVCCRGRASALAARPLSGQVLGDSWAPGRLGRGAGPEAGILAAGLTHPGGNGD